MKKWFNFINKGGALFELFLYGAIVENGWKWDDTEITPNDFKAELDKTMEAKELKIYINSPGGHIFAGLTVYHLLKRHPANKTAIIDGISASIANVISMAANKIVMPKTSMMLAHKPLAGLCGYFNASNLYEFAAELDKVEVPIVAAYQEKTGLKAEKIREILAKDTYMDAEEAVKLGFADSFEDDREFTANKMENSIEVNGIEFSMGLFAGVPENILNKIITANVKKKDEKTDSSNANKKPSEIDYGVLECTIAHNQHFI